MHGSLSHRRESLHLSSSLQFSSSTFPLPLQERLHDGKLHRKRYKGRRIHIVHQLSQTNAADERARVEAKAGQQMLIGYLCRARPDTSRRQ